MHPGDVQFVSSISPVARFRRHATDARTCRFSVLPTDWKLPRSATVQRSQSDGTSKAFVTTHPLDPGDASTILAIRTALRGIKGVRWRVDARTQFDALMEGVSPRADVTFESGTVGNIPGLWAHPASSQSDQAILYLHGGWFSAGSAKAYRHLVGHVAARAGTSAFVPDYRLAPEHPFPAAVDDVLAVYRGLDESGIRRIAIVGNSAGGNSRAGTCLERHRRSGVCTIALVGAAALSPVTDLTLSGDTSERERMPIHTSQRPGGGTRAFLLHQRQRKPSVGVAADGTSFRVASPPHSRRR